MPIGFVSACSRLCTAATSDLRIHKSGVQQSRYPLFLFFLLISSPRFEQITVEFALLFLLLVDIDSCDMTTAKKLYCVPIL